MSSTPDIVVAGVPHVSVSGATFEKTNPYTGKVVSVAAAATVEDADNAAAAAHAAFPAWAATPAAERSALLNKAADLLEERAEEITITMAEEVGSTHGWAAFNVHVTTGVLRAAAELPGQVVEDEIPSGVPGLKAYGVRKPLGAVVAIAPWNAPLILGTRAVAMPLALGNTVVFKASEECPRTQAAIVQVLRDAGVPAGAVELITNRPEDGKLIVERLIDNPKIRHINFTGSSGVGRSIAIRAAQYFKRTVLELGGKAPFVVLDDADVDAAVAGANFGAFMNSGQICMSTERVIAHTSVVEEFSAKLAAKAAAMTVGDPSLPTTHIGPVVSMKAATRIRGLIADAVDKGATLLTGGGGEGVLIEPTVIAGVTPEMEIYREESFGPVVTITSFETEDEAVELANDTDFGLSSAVYGTDLDRARAIADRIESGIIHINGATVHDEPAMPFGGVKDSGWGRFGGNYAINEFTDLRWLTYSTEERHYPI
ncbi:aldehyde dehydrogenase family protein [Nocardioides yefusunii]|uniref:Aldehyde dehydrogenase family protein n=1 Tax=Nocardioides yefusunii TaxID=2500546 RepID=A0ABW1QT15_9ACTN|nr:aldehyde dehydrogenase family protein [Nocardioides yefusunii]